MIIECKNCNKKFSVDSDLIPSNGRQIQCGSCNYIWHYIAKESPSKAPILDNIEGAQETKKDLNQNTIIHRNFDENKTSTLFEHDNTIEESNSKIENKSISNFFSYLLVFMISFVALIILIDTLKTPLINIFPQLEIILFNLFETLKDVKLFIIDLT